LIYAQNCNHPIPAALRFHGQVFFHVFNDKENRDEEVAEFSDMSAALRRGAYEARILAAESIKEHGHLILTHRIQVEVTGEHAMATVRFGDAVVIGTQ
jgi:hypothetical protein